MKIAILGHGVVGSGVSKIIEESCSDEITIAKILVRYENEMKDDRFTLDYETIVNDTDIDAVVECMGGDEPAHTYVRRALEAGKNVVSANKKMLARHLDLFDIAKEKGVKLLVEASVGGGIPWLVNLRKMRRDDHIRQIAGIMNGTTNYLLSRLFSEGINFIDALSNAQELGYAERDPSDDICGHDVRYKTCLSALKAFDLVVDEKKIPTFGIENIDDKDIAYARDNGRVIKLIGRAEYMDGKLNAYVMPGFVKKDSLFASVSSNNNILMSESEYLGKAYFVGQGAGSLPTGHAIVQDLEDLANDMVDEEAETITRKDVDNEKEGTFYIRCSDMEGFNDMIDKKIDDQSFITKRCKVYDLVKKIEGLNDEKLFIGEILDD